MGLLKRHRETARVSVEIDAAVIADFDRAVAEAHGAGYEVNRSAVVEAALRSAARRVRAALAVAQQAQPAATQAASKVAGAVDDV